jgi:NAD(P)-dependent dehydrogenase (short-subunit alcohol dehydrogenase family)
VRFLHKKSVLIMGATGGIGSAIARQCAPYAARLALHGRSRAKLEMLAWSLRRKFGNVQIEQRIANLEYAAETKEAIANYELCDFVFMAHGVYSDAGIGSQADPDVARNVFEVNLISIHVIVEELLRQLETEDRKVRAVVLSSRAAYGSRSGMGIYAMSKAGVNGYVQSSPNSRHPSCTKFRLTAATPGIVDTEMIRGRHYDPKEVDDPAIVAEQVVRLSDPSKDHLAGVIREVGKLCGAKERVVHLAVDSAHLAQNVTGRGATRLLQWIKRLKRSA